MLHGGQGYRDSLTRTNTGSSGAYAQNFPSIAVYVWLWSSLSLDGLHEDKTNLPLETFLFTNRSIQRRVRVTFWTFPAFPRVHRASNARTLRVLRVSSIEQIDRNDVRSRRAQRSGEYRSILFGSPASETSRGEDGVANTLHALKGTPGLSAERTL